MDRRCGSSMWIVDVDRRNFFDVTFSLRLLFCNLLRYFWKHVSCESSLNICLSNCIFITFCTFLSNDRHFCLIVLPTKFVDVPSKSMSAMGSPSFILNGGSCFLVIPYCKFRIVCPSNINLVSFVSLYDFVTGLIGVIGANFALVMQWSGDPLSSKNRTGRP